MTMPIKTMLTVLLLLATSAATAQDTSETDTGDGLAMGEPVSSIGQPYISETFGDWALRCIVPAEGEAERCNLYQLLINDAGVSVAEFNLFTLPEGARAFAGANVVVPLETQLTEELTLAVDGENARRYPFSFCNRAGCVARIGFTAPDIDALKAGNEAIIRIVPSRTPAQEVILRVSLSGFTAAFESAQAQAIE